MTDRFFFEQDILHTYKGNFMTTKNITGTSRLCAGGHNINTFYINQTHDFEYQYGYSNLRFLGDTGKIDSAYIEIGGSIIEKIYPSITGQTTFNAFANIFPALAFHAFVLKVHHTGEIQVEVDIFRVINVNWNERFWFKVQQLHKMNVQLDQTSVVLDFKHRCYNIIVQCEIGLDNLCLHIEDQIKVPDSYTEWAGKKRYVFDLHPTVLFSDAVLARLTFEPIRNNISSRSFAVWADTFQVCSIYQGGMADVDVPLVFE
jgi:hypothetical protein